MDPVGADAGGARTRASGSVRTGADRMRIRVSGMGSTWGSTNMESRTQSRNHSY
jgi:hypothetical protein